MAHRPPERSREVVAVLLLSGLSLGLTLLVPVGTLDWPYFAAGADVLRGDDRLGLYMDRPDIQIGPLALTAALAIEAVLGNTAEVIVPVFLASSFGPVVWLATRVLGYPVPAGRLFLAGAPGVIAWVALSGSGHLDEFLALVLVLAGVGVGVRSGKLVPAGALFGLAAAAKPWGMTTAPCVSGGSMRRSITLLVASGTVGLMFWGPFLPGVVGTAIEGYPVAYQVDAGSVWEPWRSDSGSLGSWVRVVQLLAALLAAAVASSRGATASLIAAGTVRIALDPGQWPYQFAFLAVVVVALDARRAVDSGSPLRGVIKGCGLGLVVLTGMIASWVSGALGSAILVALFVLGLRETKPGETRLGPPSCPQQSHL